MRFRKKDKDITPMEIKIKQIIDYLNDVVNENSDIEGTDEGAWLGFLKNALAWLCLAYDEICKNKR